jgi:predicted RNA-binding protein YlxR (DUF448 family)
VGCGAVAAKREIVRVVRTPEGGVVPDLTGKLAGRGAYLHATAECWETGIGKGKLARSLKTSVSPQDAEALREFARGLGLVEVKA